MQDDISAYRATSYEIRATLSEPCRELPDQYKTFCPISRYDYVCKT